MVPPCVFVGLPMFTRQPEDMNVTRGTPFTLYCEAVGPPDPVTIVWLKNSVKGPDSTKNSMTVPGENHPFLLYLTLQAHGNSVSADICSYLSVIHLQEAPLEMYPVPALSEVSITPSQLLWKDAAFVDWRSPGGLRRWFDNQCLPGHSFHKNSLSWECWDASAAYLKSYLLFPKRVTRHQASAAISSHPLRFCLSGRLPLGLLLLCYCRSKISQAAWLVVFIHG